MQTETSDYIITMTINTAHASIYDTACTGSYVFFYSYKAAHAVAQEFSSSQEVIQAGQDHSTKWKDFAGRQSEKHAARSCRIQSHRSIGLYAYALHCQQPYRVNDDSPAANDSNSFRPRSSLGCWLAYFTLESGRMLIFQRTYAKPVGWLNKPKGLGRTPVKNHWFNTGDRSTTAAAYELCCSDLLNNFSGPLMRTGAYWCVVNSVFTHCGPQYAKVRFSRAPIRRIGAFPHTLTTAFVLSS